MPRCLVFIIALTASLTSHAEGQDFNNKAGVLARASSDLFVKATESHSKYWVIGSTALACGYTRLADAVFDKEKDPTLVANTGLNAEWIMNKYPTLTPEDAEVLIVSNSSMVFAYRLAVAHTVNQPGVNKGDLCRGVLIAANKLLAEKESPTVKQ